MAQEVRKSNDIIVNALYLIGELAVGDTPDGFMIESGLELLNEILDNYNADGIYVPYLSEMSFPFVAGQGTYTISNIINNPTVNDDRIVDLVFATYTVDNQIIYPLKIISKAEYYTVTRLVNLDSRPGIIFLDKQAAQSNLTVYPQPDQAYTCTIQVKKMLDSLQVDEDIDGLPPYFYGLLKYALARKFQLYYPSAKWPETAERMYQDMYATAKNANETDLSIRPSSTLMRDRPAFWWTNILAL